jgi:hypothetical protein
MLLSHSPQTRSRPETRGVNRRTPACANDDGGFLSAPQRCFG